MAFNKEEISHQQINNERRLLGMLELAWYWWAAIAAIVVGLFWYFTN
jgi:hypothetical protein